MCDLAGKMTSANSQTCSSDRSYIEENYTKHIKKHLEINLISSSSNSHHYENQPNFSVRCVIQDFKKKAWDVQDKKYDLAKWANLTVPSMEPKMMPS